MNGGLRPQDENQAQGDGKNTAQDCVIDMFHVLIILLYVIPITRKVARLFASCKEETQEDWFLFVCLKTYF